MNKILVEVKNLQVLPNSVPITFEAYESEAVCLFGMNGNGKTLLIKSLCGVFTPFAGEGKIINPTEYTGICLQFPEHLVFCNTALKEAELVTGSTEEAERLLAEIGVKPESPPFFMSDGQKRLLFVYGLIENKKLLIFDEPFASLDLKTKDEVAKRMKAASKKGTCIIYTANRKADTLIADKIVMVE